MIIVRRDKVEVLKRIADAGIVPVVVLDNAEEAVPTAKALLKGGIDVMEITFRTAAAKDSIKAVAASCPDMLVGAGTVTSLEQCREAVGCGAKFIVMPGYDDEVVAWCVENGVAVTPGCVTPTEIMMARKRGLNVLKFFPASVYGGLGALKALCGPFPDVKFIPTGGVSQQNLTDFALSPYVYAVGGSWICQKKDIKEKNFDKITELCKEARKTYLGFEVAHLGINSETPETSLNICGELGSAFDFGLKEGNSSNFASAKVEVMKTMFRGKNGHIAISTNRIGAAISELLKRGYELDMDSVKDKKEIKSVYLKNEIGGFAIHLLQK